MNLYLGPQSSPKQGRRILKNIADGLALDREHIEFTTRGLLLYIEQLETELARLRKAVEDAPCDSWCASLGNGHKRYKCNCRKSKALGEDK